LPGERNCGGLDATLSVQRVAERSETMPETGQTPIRVYEDHDVWHVDYGEGVTRHYDSREEAESAADAVGQEEEREVVVE
jgi:hypothetical protein